MIDILFRMHIPILLLVPDPRTSAGHLSPEVEAIVDAIIQAHEAEMEAVGTGLGQAHISDITTAGEKTLLGGEYDAHFWFKGRSSRTDTLSLNPRPENDRMGQVSMADNGEFFYRINHSVGGVIVERSGGGAFKGELGKDFSPLVFFKGGLSSTELANKLKALKGDPTLLANIRTIEEGLLELKVTWSAERNHNEGRVLLTETHKITLDPEHRYRICEYDFEQENFRGPGSRISGNTKILWDDTHLQQSYPKVVSSDRITVRSPHELKQGEDGVTPDPNVERHIRVDVKEFTPDVQIKDEVFTLHGMGIKPGMRVNDAVSGLLYRYGEKA